MFQGAYGIDRSITRGDIMDTTRIRYKLRIIRS